MKLNSSQFLTLDSWEAIITYSRIKMNQERTIVGIPFYDGEGAGVLDACLKNLDSCLNRLDIDAQIVIGINGPRVCHGLPPLSDVIDPSKYNADVLFIKTPPGIVAAEKTICRTAKEQGYERIFLTDADISRLPNSIRHMWQRGDKRIVGANYAAYPPEILEAAGENISPDELALMKIFEADKHPLAREFTLPHRPEKRLKGSLLLVSPDTGLTMFGGQGITSDSRMNDLVSREDKQVVCEAAFMHRARVSLTDHIKARLRHFRAAASEGELDSFTKRSLIYSQRVADEIAGKILEKNPQATDEVSNFLLQCSLRHHVAIVCRKLASGKTIEPKDYSVNYQVDNSPVTTFSEATKRIVALLSAVDWECLDCPTANGKGVTQEDKRLSLDLEPYLASEQHRRIILSHLGLPEGANV